MSAYAAQAVVAISSNKETVLEWFPSASSDTIGYDILISAGTATPTAYTKLNSELVTQSQYTLFLPAGAYWVVIRAWDANQNYSDSDPIIITL